MLNHELALFEVRTREARTARRASLYAALGTAPTPRRPRPFARRVIGLTQAMEVVHLRPAGQAAIDRRLGQLAKR